MEKQFVSYELALKLKELGFNEECLKEYNKYKELSYGIGSGVPFRHKPTLNAPLWQQAWEFLLSKLDANIFFWGDGVGEIGGCGNQQFFSSREESIDILIMLVESTIKK